MGPRWRVPLRPSPNDATGPGCSLPTTRPEGFDLPGPTGRQNRKAGGALGHAPCLNELEEYAGKVTQTRRTFACCALAASLPCSSRFLGLSRQDNFCRSTFGTVHAFWRGRAARLAQHVWHGTSVTARLAQHVRHVTFDAARLARHVWHGTFGTARLMQHVWPGTFNVARLARHV